ncbi:MAG: hypothetical protein GY758_04370 [Fuerstiella sp.]|nr:hypothetical protein [Fuerstiella sp.]MCP4505771.1 hypothetical protein [Fuerstiella sp.]
MLQNRVSPNGRVVSQDGKGVAKTVVSIRNDKHRMLHASILIIGTAVRTDGYLQLPPVHGTDTSSVGNAIADFSQQMMLRRAVASVY